MTTGKKAGLLAVLVVAVAAAALMYWSQHLTYKAMKQEDAALRVAVLEKAAAFWPLNDRAFYELGKAHFDYAYQNLDDVDLGKDHFRRSARRFRQSLRLNPADFYGHYNYGRTLFHLDFLLPAEDFDFVREYKKAADLTGHRSEIYYQVGKMLLSQWNDLSGEDRAFTTGILKKIAARGNREQFTRIMHTWEMNVGDYAVMGQILPDDAALLRMYAEFLGEKSLDQRERHNVLALAEHLDFQRAGEEFSRAEYHFRYYRPRQAAPLYRRCLDILEGIAFYQGLTGRSPIDAAEYADMMMASNLKLAQCEIMQGRGLEEVEGYLRAYLSLSEKVADASELESYLVENRLIGERLEDSLNDLGLLSFHCLLYLKQNHYRDVKNIGEMLERSFVVVPEEDKEDYIQVLRWVAKAHQITGYFYDASDFYERALELDEGNVATLLDMRQNYERLNDEREMARIDRRLEELLAPREMLFRDKTIGKGQPFQQPMTLDGSRVSLSLVFASGEEGESRVVPLVSVHWNGRVVWEDYLREDTVILSLETEQGENRLEVRPVNRDVRLSRILWR